MTFFHRVGQGLWMASALLGALTLAKPVIGQPPIGRAKLFGNPNWTGALLSPDGRWLAWLGPRGGVLNVWVAPLTALKKGRPLTNERSWPIREFTWAPDSKSVLFRSDKDGDERFSLYGVPVAGGPVRLLTPLQRNNVTIIGTSRRVRDRILVGVSDPGSWDQNVYSLNLASGSLTQVFKNAGHYSCFTADADLELRFACRPHAGGGVDFFRIGSGGVEPVAFAEVPPEDRFATHLQGLTADGRTLYWLDSRGRDTAALTAQNLTNGEVSVIGADLRADVSQLLTNPQTGRAQAFAADYLRTTWTAIDPSIKAHLDFLKSHLSGVFNITSRTNDDRLWTVVQDYASASPITYLYDKNLRKLTKLFVNRPYLPAGRLAPMQPVEIQTRDNHREVGYLTLPSRSASAKDDRPIRPLPLVLLVHGGPNSRDDYGFNPNHQWLADRGYAILSVNFRGSKGFGKSWMAAGLHQWGGAMQDDLIDAVNWAVRNGIADPKKIAVMGESYGGYATLSALTATPTTFACGVEFAGPADLTATQDGVPIYWPQVSAREYRSDVPADRQLLLDRSPLFNVKSILVPLLIGHGANDPRVAPSESDRLVAGMASLSLPVNYLVFPGEGHSLTRPENVIAFKAIAENFLSKCLGGRNEPIGDAMKGSNAIVLRGGVLVPGLKTAP